MSLLMVAVVVLFAPALLGLALLASRLEARFLGQPGTTPVRPNRRRAAAPGVPTESGTRDQVA